MKTITRADVVDTINKEIGLSRKDCADILDMALNEISSELNKNGEVKLSSFGTFSCKQKKSRIGRNPKTGIETIITPRRVISFKASQHMKNAVNP